jgi:pantoate--beta-alanine ligase
MGIVPTMGALHEGHRSLIRRSQSECDRTVVSVFVNPRQFDSADDLALYPRTPQADLALLAEEGVHALYEPSPEVMYPPGHATGIRVGGPGADVFEGAGRPGHFDGVALVVAKLLIASRPDRAYFGEKDAQQCAVVRRLVLDLDIGVELRLCPVVREGDGLALSSRNRRLTSEERNRALAIPAALAGAAVSFAAGITDAAALTATIAAGLAAGGIAAEYIALVDPDTFERVPVAVSGCRLVVAATVGGTRLLDALTLGHHLVVPTAPALCQSPPMPVMVRQ